MTRIGQAFAARGARPLLVPYITAGDPSLEATVEIALALAEAGAGVIELGVPFSDPVADGPVIQAASERAVRRGVALADVLEVARQVRRQSEVALLLFSYYNPILHHGLERFAAEAAAAGCDGVLVTDLIAEEAEPFRGLAQRAGLDTVFLAAPTSPDARLQTIGQASSGFVYAVSRLGVTGARATLAAGAEDLVRRLRRQTSLPLALGFGLSCREQVADVARFADGAVVGTALVETITQAPPGREAAAASEFLRKLQ